MTFVKVVKNKAYFKRYQVKFRRRRECKTDYYARKRLITQAKNKYNSPKHRLVVRITNGDVICQVVSSKIEGDKVVAAAYSHELPKYGIKLGLTNWAATYATGLLLARRLLAKLPGMSENYLGVVVADGLVAPIEENETGARPFKACLDVGLARTTLGARVFAAMKGASDGGLNVPHSEQRFPGYDKAADKLDTDVLRSYIYGGNVADYMRHLKEEDEDKYKIQFSRFISAGIEADHLEGIYESAHAAIRADPSRAQREKAFDVTVAKAAASKYRQAKLNLKQRKERVRQKKVSFFDSLNAKAMAAKE